MSTRTSIVVASARTTVMHLYREMHDDHVHLEITMAPTNLVVNLVVPDPMVAGVTEILARADDETRTTSGLARRER